MAEREQVPPLSPEIDRRRSNEDDSTKDLHLQKLGFIKRCVCPVSLLLLLATVIIIVLILTVFYVKDPIMQMNSVKVTKLNLVNITTLIADVLIKNPNFASFKYNNTTTTLYYHGIMVGEARGPPGTAKSRRTVRMNVTLDVITERIISSPYLKTDLPSGVLTISSFSRVPGQMKILNLFNKHALVKTNCTTTFSIFTQTIKEQNCKWKYKL